MPSSVINDYIAGAIGGSAGLIVGHPFDTTKVQLQTQQTGSPYRSTWDAIKNINHHGMARGFFRGMGFPLVSYGVINSVFFGVYGHTLRKLLGEDSTKAAVSYRAIFLAGCAGGLAQLAVACPVDVVKVILQSQISRPGAGLGGQVTHAAATGEIFFQGPLECFKQMYRHGGLRTLYTGVGIMGIRDLPALVVYMWIYEEMFRRLARSVHTDDSGVMASVLAGGTAGVASWGIIMPLDVIKSNIQADFHRTKYKGILDCVQSIYRHGGVRAFFTGFVVNSFRAFPVNAVTFLFYSQTRRVLQKEAIPVSAAAESGESGQYITEC